MEHGDNDEEEEKALEDEIAALESDINFQTTLTLEEDNSITVDSIHQLPLQSNNNDDDDAYRILVTLKLAHLLPSNHIDANTSTMLHPQIHIQATRLEMTLNEVLVMACEYWHIARNAMDGLVLLNEHGVWRPLTHRVVEIEYPSDVVLLFLDQKPLNMLQEVRVALERGSSLLQNEPAQRETAPLLLLLDDMKQATRPKRKQKLFLRTSSSSQQQQKYWILAMRRVVKTHVRNLRDPFLFNTRRWFVEFMLSIGLVAVLSVYLVDILPRYSASQLFAHAEEELGQMDYNLVVWLQHSPSLNAFFNHDLYGFGQSTLVDNTVKLAQNRVMLSAIDYLAPAYTLKNEQIIEYWKGTRFTNTNESFSGRFAHYGKFAYLVELTPGSSSSVARLQELESVNWLDNSTRLAKVQFQVFSRNFNETVHYSVFVETNEANLQQVTTRVTYSMDAVVTPTWFIFLVALFLTCIGLDLIRSAWFVKQAKFPTWALVWQAISVRNTVLNPLILLLGIIAVGTVNPQVMAVCNILATVKLYTFMHIRAPMMQRQYWQRISINLSGLLLFMLVSMCAFAWLLVVAVDDKEDFNQTFMWLACQLVRGIRPVWWNNMPVARVFTVVASQLLINLLLLRICIPICYYAMCT